jgi:hypothetical protein
MPPIDPSNETVDRAAVQALRESMKLAEQKGLVVRLELVEARLSAILRRPDDPACEHTRVAENGFKYICRDCGMSRDWGVND